MNKIIYCFLIFILFSFSSIFLFAHQPRIVRVSKVIITQPEISQAFYGELKGFPEEFIIESERDFKLYVGLLLPDLSKIKKDISAEIYHVRDGENEIIAFLDGKNYRWTAFFEKYGKDNYLWGPEFKASDSIKGKELKGKTVSSGKYLIKVFNDSNEGKYVLVIGFLEKFPIKEILRTIFIYPHLKATFFNDSLFMMFSSFYVWLYLSLVYFLSFIVGIVYRFSLRKLARTTLRKSQKNIGKRDRIVRLIIGIGLFFLAIFTSWSPILIFFSGFCMFEAIFSWCGFYALIGKSSCPI